jgi:hypothetical protein
VSLLLALTSGTPRGATGFGRVATLGRHVVSAGFAPIRALIGATLAGQPDGKQLTMGALREALFDTAVTREGCAGRGARAAGSPQKKCLLAGKKRAGRENRPSFGRDRWLVCPLFAGGARDSEGGPTGSALEPLGLRVGGHHHRCEGARSAPPTEPLHARNACKQGEKLSEGTVIGSSASGH